MALWAPRPAAAAGEPSRRQELRVVAFGVTPEAKPNHALDASAAGASLLLAERLDGHPALRVAGPAAMMDRTPWPEALRGTLPGGTRYVMGGSLTRLGQGQVRVEVRLWGRVEARVVGESTLTCRREDLSRTALKAAVEALRAAGVATDPATDAAITAPFGRDPYAFILYARGVAAYFGLDGHPGSGERALVGLGRSMVVDPKVPETRRLVGLIHLENGRPGHARAQWEYAVDLRPSYRAAWAHLADLDRTQGLPSAAQSYQKVLALDPEDVGARRALGELLAEAGRLEEAETELDRVVAAWPNDLRARRALAVVLAGRHAGADLAQELEVIVRLDPSDVSAALELGAAYASLGRADQALTVYEDVLRSRPKNAAVLKIVGDLWRSRGEFGKAIPYYEKLRRLDPADPRPLFALGETHFRHGDLAQAERMFTEAAQIPGMLGEAYGDLGAVALARGQVKEALYFLAKAAERRPGRAVIRYNHGLALHQAGREDDALRELGEAVRLDDHDADAWFALGVVELRRHELPQARACFHKVLALAPTHREAEHNLALLAVVLGRETSETTVTFPAAAGLSAGESFVPAAADHVIPATNEVSRDGGRDR
jgi:tetratricopeptide (TPR) repeat protein